MPKDTTTGTTAADATTTAQTTPDGATPPVAASAASNDSMSLEEARATLRGLREGTPRERNPLLDEDASDPLTNEGKTLEDVLGIGAADSPLEPEPDPAAKDAEPTVETAEPEPVAEVPATDEAAQAALAKTEQDGRRRININRKDASGKHIHSDKTRIAAALADERGVDMMVAYLDLFGTPPQSASAALAEAAKPEPQKSVAELDAAITALKTKRADARKKYASSFDDADNAAAAEASDAIEDLQQQRTDAIVLELKQQTSKREAETTFQQQEDQSITRATALYPDAGKEGTELFDAVQAEVLQLTARKSPLLDEPDWPELVTARVANRLGTPAKTQEKAHVVAKPVTPAAAPAKPAAPVKRATPVPAPGSVSGGTPAANPRAELEKRIETETDPVKLQQLMREAIKLERQRAA